MDLQAIRRVLVPTDFTDPSNEALATAIAFARLFGATLDLVHVAGDGAYPLPPPLDVGTVPFDLTKAMQRANDELLTEVARVRAAGVACDSATLIGRADAEIVDRAKATHADLIVMGTHGRSGLAHALLGGVTDRVVKHAPCPLLIVPKPATAV
jgi:nucleotide-binding universal stress UspA family protein